MRIGFFIASVPLTKDILDGRASLGGSESACIGLARALVKRGHDVHISAMNLAEDCAGRDAAGVAWHHGDGVHDLAQIVEWDLFVSLRMYQVFQQPVKAKLRWLWNQDMLIGEPQRLGLMSCAWAYDRLVYVSEYHQKQWEGAQQELAGIGWVTKNGYDPAFIPTDVEKQWQRIVHISRPERGLTPLLAMWPELKKRVPEAELRLCRYQSMYDGEGSNVRAMCDHFDREVARVNQEVGGITWLGGLGKADLYREIATASVMWYPGVVDFAETSCIAAIEAQACGTPFIGSWKGALPETVPSGVLIPGDAMTPEYQAQAIDAVVEAMTVCKRKGRAYRDAQEAGRQHVTGYTYDAIAEEWEAEIERSFTARYEANTLGVLRQLLHYDDHSAALNVASTLCDQCSEAADAVTFCQRVIAGEEQTADHYAEFALADPLVEWDHNGRFHAVVPWFTGRKVLLDVACGNGSFCLGMAVNHPELIVVGVDYAPQNIERAKAAAEKAGLADRCFFYSAGAYDFETHTQTTAQMEFFRELVGLHGPFDALFCGEFLEHVYNCTGLIDLLESYVAEDGLIVYTVPNGPFSEMLAHKVPVHKGHVHHFTHEDLNVMFRDKHQLYAEYIDLGMTGRGQSAAHWLIRYTKATGRTTHERPYADRIRRTRPKAKLSVGIIARNAEATILKCLESVWNIADEIVIGDTGSTDDTIKLATDYATNVRVVRIPPVDEDPDGFAGARNKVLAAATGDWFLWIDSDEVLLWPHAVWKYLEGGVFNGYVIQQNHLMLDCPMNWDKPIRLFKRLPSIQFYGCVHEQPQMGDSNGDIVPCLYPTDVQIAHDGYLLEGTRRWKMKARNLPLLKKDMARFPDRRLGKVLVLRDLVNLAEYYREQANGQTTEEVRRFLSRAIALYEAEFKDRFDDKFYPIARPWYERAIQHVTGSFEFEFALAGRVSGMEGKHAQVKKIWVRRPEDIEPIVQHSLAEIKKQGVKEVIDVAPIKPAPERAGVAA